MTRRALAGAGIVVLGAALLSSCGADPRQALRADVQRITAQANAHDAAGVRSGVDDLLKRIDAAQRAGQLTAAEATGLRRTALAVRTGADAVDADLLTRQRAEQAARDAQQAEQQRAAAATPTAVPTTAIPTPAIPTTAAPQPAAAQPPAPAPSPVEDKKGKGKNDGGKGGH